MKKNLLLIFLLVFAVSGCSAQTPDSEAEDDLNENVYEEISEETSEEADMEEEFQDLEIEEKSLRGDIIVGCGYKGGGRLIIIRKDDGTVWAKGSNRYGQLGNGSRIDSEEYVQVSGLQNIQYIFTQQTYGFDDSTKYYALDSEGNLWEWGGNVLKPEIKDIEHKIVRILEENTFTEDTILMECDDGNTYLFREVSIKGESEYKYEGILLKYDLPSESAVINKNICVDGDTIIIYYGSLYNAENYLDCVKEIARINIEDEMGDVVFCSSVGSGHSSNYIENTQEKRVFCLNSEGTAFEIRWDEDKDSHEMKNMEINNLGGSGIEKTYQTKSYVKEANRINLLSNGELFVYGDNSRGQLGDGTYYDYYEDWLRVETDLFRDFTCLGYGDSGYYGTDCYGVVAVSRDSNRVWYWGIGEGSTPVPIIEPEDFY